MRKSIPMVLVAATVLTLMSCGSNKRVSRPGLPSRTPVAEITLEDLIGGSAVGGRVSEVELSTRSRAVVEAANKWLGTPYKYGGDSRRGVDCSALVMNVYKEALGMKIPRTSRSQREFVTDVPRRSLQPGDLVFFSSGKNRNGVSHVGLFIGGDRFIHASSSRGVVVSKLSEKYFVAHYHSSGRVVDMAPKNRADAYVIGETVADEAEMRLEMLDRILTATIDSIYSMPVDDDPNLAPGL